MADTVISKLRTWSIFLGKDNKAHHRIYATSPDGTVQVDDDEAKTCTIWEDKDKNGKYDTRTIWALDDSQQRKKAIKIEKLDEKQNDISSVQAKILAEMQNEESAYYRSKLKIDGKIDKFSQSKDVTGDCWLLAGLEALSGTKNGAKIIKDSIAQDKDGNVTVTLKGVGEKYTFTPKEISDAASRLSTGDDDVRVIEMAVEQHRLKTNKLTKDKIIIQSEGLNRSLSNRLCGNSKISLDGGTQDETFFLLTGEKSAAFKKSLLPLLKKFQGYSTNPQEFLTMKQNQPYRYAMVITFGKNEGEKYTKHGYTLKSVDNASVTIINPWDSSKEIKMDKKDFMDSCNGIYSCDMGQ